METHSEEAPHKCTICGKGFTLKHNLKRHLRIHTDGRPYVCPVCGKLFIQSSRLWSHSKVHSEETPHKCLSCGKGFKHKNSLIRHLNETIHTCSNCGKKDLIAYLRVDSGEGPQTCSTCKKPFSQNIHLSSCMKTHVADGPHKCFTCGKEFKHKHSLAGHRRVHKSEQPVGHELYTYSSSLSNQMISLMNQVMPESFVNEAEQSQEISLSYEDHSSTTANDKGARDRRLPTSRSTNLPALHFSSVPYILKVKIEDDT